MAKQLINELEKAAQIILVSIYSIKTILLKVINKCIH